MTSQPIGIFDSGIGGLSVLAQIQQLVPNERLIYLADQAHVPYGLRPAEEIIAFSAGITRFFQAQSAKAIVVACNTASAAALTRLRQLFPEMPFIGMEPAVKPATLETRSGQVGVLATAGTLGSGRYASLMSRFGENVTVWEDPCVGLVELIEAGETQSVATERYLRDVLSPMQAQGVDTLVLGCTHYSFILPLLERLVGDEMTIIDPAPAVARQTQVVLQQLGLLTPAVTPAPPRYLTSGRLESFTRLVERFTECEGEEGTAVWQKNELTSSPR